MQRTVIYGGSFDPVHKAHIDITEKLCARFDRVIVVPCKISPFKQRKPASGAMRTDMLKAALCGLPVEISTFELDSPDENYSYITAEHFAERGAKLYYAIGSEMLPFLKDWKNFDRLCAATSFYIIPRPGFPVTESILKSCGGADIEIADFTGGEGSSTEVKISLAMGEPHKFLDKSTAAYIEKQGMYRDYCYVNDLYKKYGMKPSRVRHSYSTALCGAQLAKRMNIDTDKAATALLLHDIGKYVTSEAAEKMGLHFSVDLAAMPEPIRHAEIGACILSQLEGITDSEIIGAVRWHTTGKAAMSPLEIVVFLADFIEPFRDFAGVDEVRRATEKSVADGLKEALIQTVKYIKPEDLYYTTKEALNYYTK